MPPVSGNPITAYIKGDTKGLEQAVGRAKKTIAGIGRGLAGVIAGGAALAGVREIDQLATAALGAADEIGKAAKTAGIGAKALQEYRYAAEKAGNTQKQFDDAVGRFNRRLGEGRNGNKAYADTFRQMGVTVQDTNEQALEKTFNFLAGITDEAKRTSYATKVFGDDARRMALLVKDGAKSLADARKEARDYGVVLDDDLVKAAEKAKDKLTLMERQLDVELYSAVLKNIDGLIAFKTLMNDIAKGAVGFVASIGNAARGLKAFSEAQLEASIADLESKGSRDFAIGGGGSADAATNRERLRALRAELQRRRSSVTLDDIDAALGPGTAPPPGSGGGFNFKGKTPGVPTLKSDALFKEAEKAQDRIAQIVEQNATPLQKLQDQLEEISDLRDFAETPAQLAALDAAAAAVKKQIVELKDATNDWKRASVDAAAGISDAFASALVYGDKLGDSLKRLAQQLASRLISNFLFNAITGGSGGGLFGGFRAGGGPVSAGRTYLVGERGPELFTPAVSGGIIPNGGIGGAVNVTVHNHFDVGLESVDQRIAQRTPGIAAAVSAAVERARTRPGYA